MKSLLSLFLTLTLFFSSFSQESVQFDSLLINKFIDQVLPGYSVLIGNYDSIIYETQYGYADLKNKTKITSNTKFRIGSITKQFTAIAILKLVEAGKLELNTPAQNYVDFLPKKITIAHLLWHTSGLISYFDDEDIADSSYTRNYTSKELVDLLSGKKTISKPDINFHYSNSGYHILGYIIEQISGQTYSEFLTSEIFKPLNMFDTECEFAISDIKNLGIGYEYSDSNLIIPGYYTMDWPYSAGNIVSTPTDLLKWNNALFQGEIISDSLLEVAHTAHILKKGDSTHYAFGWEIRQVQSEKIIRHSGYLEGYLSILMFFPKYNITVVVLNNCSNYSTELFATKLGALAIGKPINDPKQFPLSPIQLQEFENNYDFDGGVISYVIINGELCFYLDYDESALHAMYPIGENIFYSTEFGCTVNFNKEHNSMILKIGQKETTGKMLNNSKK
jgi:CubicO group peptidase (beta-lactamase class C family)